MAATSWMGLYMVLQAYITGIEVKLAISVDW
jgi:hypothetical protein